jgi:hypothetical protein
MMIRTEFAHGCRYKNEFRTIMAVECGSSSFSTLPYYSINKYLLSGNQSLGNATHDNVRQIRVYAPIVEQYQPSKVPTEPAPSPLTIFDNPTQAGTTLTCRNDTKAAATTTTTTTTEEMKNPIRVKNMMY